MLDAQTAASWRGHELIDRDGDKIGTIESVYLDGESMEPEWITVKTGLFGSKQTFVPIRDATSEGEIVRVPFEKSHVKDAPNIDPEQELSQGEERDLYEHYGVDYDTESSGTQLPQHGAGPGQEPMASAGSESPAPGAPAGEGSPTGEGAPASQGAATGAGTSVGTGAPVGAGTPVAAQGEWPQGETVPGGGDGDDGDDDDDRSGEGSPTPDEGERGVAVPGESDTDTDDDNEDGDSSSLPERRPEQGMVEQGVVEQGVVEQRSGDESTNETTGADAGQPRLRLRRYVVTEEITVERDS